MATTPGLARPAPETPPVKEVNENGPATETIARAETTVLAELYLDPGRIEDFAKMHPGDRFELEAFGTRGPIATLLVRKGRLVGRLPLDIQLDDLATWEATSVFFFPSERPLTIRLRPHTVLDCGCVLHHLSANLLRRCDGHQAELDASLKDETCEHGVSLDRVCGRCTFEGDRRTTDERRCIDEATR